MCVYVFQLYQTPAYYNIKLTIKSIEVPQSIMLEFSLYRFKGTNYQATFVI